MKIVRAADARLGRNVRALLLPMACALAAVTATARVARAQVPLGRGTSTAANTTAANLLTAGCPGGNGIHISVNSGTGSNASDGTRTGTDSSSLLNTVVDEARSVDTTIVFNIAQKNWTRTNLAAAITAGLADQSRGGFAVCAGITAFMPSATLSINGARGTLHFAATLQDLLNSIRTVPGATSPQPRRM
jgi:hypothetical protein